MIKPYSPSSKQARSKKNAGRKKASQPLGLVRIFSVDNLTHEGKGVARDNGKVTFIAGALPNETVQAQVFKSNRRFDEAKLIAIEHVSENRVKPACEHFANCGGCSFQHLATDNQRQAKQLWLQGQLRKVVAPEVIQMLADAPLAYRRRARLAVRLVAGKLLLGFRSQSSSQITPIQNCIVLTQGLQQIFSHLKQALVDAPIAESMSKKIGHLELLEDDKGVSVLCRLTANITPNEQAIWQEWAKQNQAQWIWQMPDETRANVNQLDKRFYHIDGLKLHYHPQDFIQVNAVMNEKMLAQAIDWLAPTKDDLVLDLFCGVGNFSLPLAKYAKQVVGVEVQQSMVQAAIDNAKLNNLTNASFIAADLTKDKVKSVTALGVTKVLLDPPRAGAYDFLPNLVKLKPKVILYVSCDAATLARDAEYLLEKGYKVSRAAMMDMFPQTSHLETMLLFVR
ncbi:23S rRNA (uracil(1939)-C(5))-methyltransferase RlmD [Paraglaciecola aestuariivivens]